MNACESVGCPNVAEYEIEGKKYCPQCYSKVIKAKNGLPKGRAGMGAATVIINEC